MKYGLRFHVLWGWWCVLLLKTFPLGASKTWSTRRLSDISPGCPPQLSNMAYMGTLPQVPKYFFFLLIFCVCVFAFT